MGEDDAAKQGGAPKFVPGGNIAKPEPGAEGWTDLGGSSSIGYFPGALKALCKETGAFEELQKGLDWQQCDVTVMGKTVPQPRLIAYFSSEGDAGSYTYSGLTLTPKPFTPLILRLKEAVEVLAGTETFDSVLLNLYRDGSDHVGWHADNEKLYGQEPTIASLSLGTARDFVLRSNSDASRKINFPLGEGDVVVMRGRTQLQWQHCVPKRGPADKYGPRISLTFRKIVDPGAKGVFRVDPAPSAAKPAAGSRGGAQRGEVEAAQGLPQRPARRARQGPGANTRTNAGGEQQAQQQQEGEAAERSSSGGAAPKFVGNLGMGQGSRSGSASRPSSSSAASSREGGSGSRSGSARAGGGAGPGARGASSRLGGRATRVTVSPPPTPVDPEAEAAAASKAAQAALAAKAAPPAAALLVRSAIKAALQARSGSPAASSDSAGKRAPEAANNAAGAALKGL